MKLGSLSSLLLLLLSLFVLLCVTHADESTGTDSDTADTPAFELPDDAALLKMKVKELKQILSRKGSSADCLACTSKQEYVDRIHETLEWPDVTPSPTPDTTFNMDDEKNKEELEKLFSKNKDPKYMAELKEKLKAAGIDTKNIFMGDEINPDIIKTYKKSQEEEGSDIKDTTEDYVDKDAEQANEDL